MVALMNYFDGSSEKFLKAAPVADEIVFRASLLALSAALETASQLTPRSGAETCIDISRAVKRKNRV
jgi:hypothetical protein